MLLISDSIKINAPVDHVFRMSMDSETLYFLIGQYGNNIVMSHNDDELVGKGKIYQLYKNNKPLSQIEIQTYNPSCLLEMNVRLMTKKFGIPEKLFCKAIYAQYGEGCLFQYSIHGDIQAGMLARLAVKALSQNLKNPRNKMISAWVSHIEKMQVRQIP